MLTKGGWNSRSREEGAPADQERVVPCSILRAFMVGWERLAKSSKYNPFSLLSILFLVMNDSLVKWDILCCELWH